ncbi:CHRD domain-containing protein [Spirosoma radiotolerans]|uniref:CHRD domain containing protein n=1 Tax=Spirosoma radiotolerans TaxID=1379870 RepID=A0A0E3ZW79_9BACT|nr:CHRD domain-containing protein [Spirosoma radiotolerans]AKD55533.1 CHRD domain containing protein [Spirosoma radiotolerans]
MNKKNILLSVAALLGLSLAISSCGNDENPTISSTTTRFGATLTGLGEKPTSTTSTATGTFVGNLDETTRVLSYTVTYAGFNEALTGGHLHRIDSTKTDGTGPVDIPFPSLTSPIIGSTSALSPLQVYRIKAGQYYANLHTKTYPGGEIRGEVRKQ